MTRPSTHSPLAVLLLEDSDPDAELICLRLAVDGLLANVHRTRTRAEYEAALARGPLDIILSDFRMPGYDGFAALEAARKTAPGVPFIFVSGAIGEERALDTLRRGATDYVLKDRLERLVPAVRRALDEMEQRRLRIDAERERDRLLVSERQARELAEAANRMKDEFLAVVSHELRTPLNAILGWASLLSSGQADAATQGRALGIIERNARVQARLIEDILEISGVITGKFQLRLENISLSKCINAALEAVRPAANAKGIALTVDSSEVCEVRGDADRVQQVVWNLLSNAVKFTPKGGSVDLRVQRVTGGAEIRVTDSGMGIDASFVPYVFERFRQEDASKTRVHGGLGLGLAIVRHLVELHGGTVSACSDGPGRGACFTVLLPLALPAETLLAAQQEPEEQSAALSPDSLLGMSVLVVEDEPDTRELIGRVLESSGARVTVACSAIEALGRLQGERPTVIISDIGMPGADGYDFMRRVRALPEGSGGQTPAIALTAYAHDHDRREAEAAGFQMHLAKPVSPHSLVSAVVDAARGR